MAATPKTARANASRPKGGSAKGTTTKGGSAKRPGKSGYKVTIANTGAVIDCSGDTTILHAAVTAGIDFPYACATGNCGECIAELRAGTVSMLPYGDGALSKAQHDSGRVLGCRARPETDVEVVWLGRGRK